ncbi:hypothetical protein H1R20_g2902, partial [Candolleomyces eurysporus]
MSPSLHSYKTPVQVPPAGTVVEHKSSGNPVPTLFQPLTIRGVTFQNRIFLSPLCQYSADDGFVNHWHLAHLGGVFTRGPGLSMVEATGVQPQGRITPWDVGLWSDDHIAGLAEIAQFAHSQNQKIGIQLAHAGRKASTLPPFATSVLADKDVGGWPDDVWAPSAIPFESSYPQPKELTKAGIKKVVEDWASAAKRAITAGFDVIEVHAAHGFLLHEFLSPVSNKRTDEYGGNFENRIRLVVEVVDAVRASIPESTPLFVRVSGTDWLEEVAPNEPSWTSEETVKLAQVLSAHGVDLLDVSSGGSDPRQKISGGPGYQVRFAAAVKSAVGSQLLVSAVGGLAEGSLAQKVLDDGHADVILVGRMFQKNPGQVWAMADQIGVEIEAAKQIGWGFKGRGAKALGGAPKVSKP